MNKTDQQSKWRGRFFRYAPLILWIGLIFFLSSTQGAMTSTSRFVRPFLEFLFPNAPEETLKIYHAYIRKAAHPTVYAVLAFFAARAFFWSQKLLLKNRWFLISLLTVFTVASLDELNQSFNAARTGTFYDVLLDTAGGFLMLTVIYLWRRKNVMLES